MKKLFLSVAMLLSAFSSWAQLTTSPYKGVAPDAIVSGQDYYLYNVESGLWLQNNDRKANDWSTRAQLGSRGLDFQLNAKDGGYYINAKFGQQTINRDNYYLDNNVDHVWIFEAKGGSVQNAVNIKSGTRFLAADNYTAGNGYDNAYKVGAKGTAQWYLNNPENNAANGTWQIVSKEERLAVMLEEGKTETQDATWLVQSPDFANNDSRFNAWTKTGTWTRTGDANGDWGRGSMGVETWNQPATNDISQTISIPNGRYAYSIQGFYRDGNAGNDPAFEGIEAKYEAGNEVIKAKYYANESEALLRSIIDPVHTTAMTGPDTWRYSKLGHFYFPNSMQDCSRAMNIENGYTNPAIEVTVTAGTLKIGVKKTDAVEHDWVVIDNVKLMYLGPVTDLTTYINALNSAITEAESFNGSTTDALAAALQSALNTAKEKRTADNADEISAATAALKRAVETAKAADVSVLRPTVALAKAEGIDVAAQEDYLANGTTPDAEARLRLVRNLRKLNAIEKVDITKIECSEPKAEEADYYLYNVGARVFFNTTADWGTHIAIDNPGMLIHFRPDGEWDGAAGRPVFHLSGNGWDGMNWSEEYWDKNGENKLAFVPVEGKEKTFLMCEWDNYNWHFVYDPADDACDQDTHYWNTVQKRNKNLDDYKADPYAQWMLVSPEAYKAAMSKATKDSPLDVTFLVNNPNFTKENGKEWTRGWEGAGGQMRGQDREPWMVIEWFESDADMHQTVNGLRPGKYSVTCYGFYRDGRSDEEATKAKNGQPLQQNAFLYANGERMPLCNVSSATGMLPGIGDNVNGVAIDFANWPWQANEYFQTGLYKNTLEVVVDDSGELTLGVDSKYNGVPGSWVVVGNFRLAYLGAVQDKAVVGSANYSTYVAPFDIETIPAGVEAFAAHKGKTSVRLEPVTSIPAGTAVVLKNTGEYTFNIAENAVELGTSNDLIAATEPVMVSEAFTYYVLNKGSKGVGFYPVKVNTTIAAGKGYIKGIPSEAKTFIPFGDELTGISDIEEPSAHRAVYNVAGQRLAKPAKGVNIIDGKTVIIK